MHNFKKYETTLKYASFKINDHFQTQINLVIILTQILNLRMKEILNSLNRLNRTMLCFFPIPHIRGLYSPEKIKQCQ